MIQFSIIRFAYSFNLKILYTPHIQSHLELRKVVV